MNNEDPIFDLERAAYADRAARQAHIESIQPQIDSLDAFFQSPESIARQTLPTYALEAIDAAQNRIDQVIALSHEIEDMWINQLHATDAYAERLERRNRVLLHVIWALSGTCALWMGVAIWSLT
jgi:hypothetical protein